jgi:hypothetical protein
MIEQVIQQIENTLNNHLNIFDKAQSKLLPFKVKGISLLEVRVPSYDNSPLSYSKWDLLVHREGKLYGFTFQAIFLHIENISYFCHDFNHSQMHEDMVQTVISLPHQSLSGSESGSSPLYS